MWKSVQMGEQRETQEGLRPPPPTLQPPFADPLLPSVLGRSARSTKASTAPPRGAGDLVLADPQRLAHPAGLFSWDSLSPLPCPTSRLVSVTYPSPVPLHSSFWPTPTLQPAASKVPPSPTGGPRAPSSLPALPRHHLQGWPLRCVKRFNC